MATVWETLRLTSVEFRRLLARTARTLAGIWPQAVGLVLLGWSANNLTVLLGTEVAARFPLAVIPVVALGAVLQLVAILALLRLAARHLGPGRPAAGPDAPTPTTGDRFTRLVAMTLLTFLVLYAGFGYLAEYARRVVLLSTYRKGYGDLLGALNPLRDPTVGAVMAGTVVVGWLFGRLLERMADRLGHPVPVKFLAIAVEAVVGLTILLGVFRLFEWVQLWLSDRVLAAWWDGFRGWAKGILHLDLPAFLVSLWTGFVEIVWPVLSTGVLRPLVWLAMAGLVFGARVLTLEDLWRPESPEAARPAGILRTDTVATSGLRTITLRLQDVLFGGLNERVVPAWQSFRLVLRAGWPFLGAYVLAFTLVDLAGQWLEHAVIWLIGGHEVSFWIKVDPFVDLVTTVAVSGFQWVLLAVAYDRALGVEEEAGLSSDGPVRSGRPREASRAVEAVTVSVVSVAVIVAAGLAVPGPVEPVQRVGTNQRVELQGERAIAGDPRLAHAVTRYGQDTTTDRIFVVVPFGVGSPGNPSGLGIDVTLESAGRTYEPFDGVSLVSSAPPGFSMVQELAFEVDPDDVGPDAVLRLRPVELVSGTQQQAEISLGLGADAVDAAALTTELANSTKAAL